MGLSAALGAQEVLPEKSIPIRAENSTTPNTSASQNNSSIFNSPEFMPSPTIDMNKNNANSSFDLSTPENKNFMEKEQFLNPGEKYEKRLNKRQGEGENRGGNYKVTRYLGDFKTKSKAVKIVCRDHEYVDGDRVRIYLNDSVVVYNIVLEGGYKGFDLPLEKGFNKIEFQALNQGSSGPNTAELRVYGDQGELLSANEWLLHTGGKATMVIVKEDDD